MENSEKKFVDTNSNGVIAAAEFEKSIYEDFNPDNPRSARNCRREYFRELDNKTKQKYRGKKNPFKK